MISITRFGATAFKLAIFSNPNPEIPEILLANGAAVEADALVNAAFNMKDVALLEKLFSSVKSLSKDDLTRMLIVASAYNTSVDILKWILSKGANVNAIQNGSTALL